VVTRFEGKARTGLVIYLLYSDHTAAEKGDDPKTRGFVYALTIKNPSGNLKGTCSSWRPTDSEIGYRCSRVDPYLPVVVVGAESEPFEEGESTLETELKGPGNMLATGIDVLSEILKKENVAQELPKKRKLRSRMK
jgi:hypothetical protein